MRQTWQHRITATVAYADIFDYPLTPSEVDLWMIGSGVGAIRSDRTVQKFQKENVEYVTLVGRESLWRVRRKRITYARNKWRLAHKVASFFYWIPTVLLVGVTGGLSMNNAKRNDDIDLFIITRSGALWTSRLLVSVVTQILGLRRVPNQKHVTNKICLNMFMADNALALDPNERDLFGAHEVLQMIPLWERAGVYKQFLYANSWVKWFLPNAWEMKRKGQRVESGARTHVYFSTLYSLLFTLIEPLARWSQLWYMSKRRTSEVIEADVLRFHPLDARGWVRQKYANRLKRLKLPLDKIFYHR